jgi:hypothetical protein
MKNKILKIIRLEIFLLVKKTMQINLQSKIISKLKFPINYQFKAIAIKISKKNKLIHKFLVMKNS